MEDRYTLVEDSNNTYLVTRVSWPEGGHPSGWDGWRLGPGTGGGTRRRDCSGTHDLYRGSATVGAVGMTISMIPNYYSERGLTQRAVSGGDPATRGARGVSTTEGKAGGVSATKWKAEASTLDKPRE